MPEHTPEPWRWEPGYAPSAALVLGPTLLSIGVFTGERAHEDAARCVACVNALKDMPLSVIEGDRQDLGAWLLSKNAHDKAADLENS